jgi:hypothetical protein
MAIFRFVAVVLIVLGLMLLGADVVTMLERGEEPHIRTLGDVWALFSGLSVEAFNALIVEGVPAPVSEGIVAGLGLPAFACFLGLGVVLAFLFRQSVELE